MSPAAPRRRRRCRRRSCRTGRRAAGAARRSSPAASAACSRWSRRRGASAPRRETITSRRPSAWSTASLTAASASISVLCSTPSSSVTTAPACSSRFSAVVARTRDKPLARTTSGRERAPFATASSAARRLSGFGRRALRKRCRAHVAGVVVQLDDRGLAVPPRPSDLLVVVVERARRGGVEHEPHVGLVDAHAEGRGGHDDGGRARAEPVVHRLAPGPTEARVVGLRRDPAAAQRLGEAAGLGARGAVDQAPAPVLLGEGGGAVDHRAAPLVLVDVQRRRQVQVGAVERPDHLDRVVEPQPVEHVGAHRRRGGRGEGQHRRLAQLRDHVTEAQVVRSEVVAPLRDAVRLVDHEQPDGREPEPFDHVGARELLGGEEHVRGAAFVHDLPRPPVLLGPLHRVDHHCLRRVLAVGALGDAGALVALQRHQRRDDQGRPLLQHRRHLVDRRLARAGGQHRQHVPACRDGLHRRELLGAQLVPPERLGRDPLQIPRCCAHRDPLPRAAGKTHTVW